MVDALATAERLIRSATASVESVDVTSDEAVTAVGRYFDELDQRFPGGFDPGDARTADLEAMRPPAGDFLVLRVETDVVACAALGAARLGWLASGGAPAEVLTKPPVVAEYAPNPVRHAALRERHERYRALYRHVRPLFEPSRKRLA